MPHAGAVLTLILGDLDDVASTLPVVVLLAVLACALPPPTLPPLPLPTRGGPIDGPAASGLST